MYVATAPSLPKSIYTSIEKNLKTEILYMIQEAHGQALYYQTLFHNVIRDVSILCFISPISLFSNF